MSDVYYLSPGEGNVAGAIALNDLATWFVREPGIKLAQDQGGWWTLTLPLAVSGADSDTAVAAKRAVRTLLNSGQRARLDPHGPGTPLTLGVQYGTVMVYWDVLSGALTTDKRWEWGAKQELTLTLKVTRQHPRGSLTSTTVSGTLVNGVTPAYLVSGTIHGDHPGLVGRVDLTDVSTGGVFLNGARLWRRSGPAGTLLTDYSACVDLAANGGASQADATALGGSYIRRSLSAASWTGVARATMPSGALQKGVYRLIARVRDGSAVMPAPTALAGTEQQPTLASIAADQVKVTAIPVPAGHWQANVQKVSPTDTSASVTITTDRNIAQHSGLVATVLLRGFTGTTVPTFTVPSGFSLKRRTNTIQNGNGMMALYEAPNVAAQASGATFTFSVSGLAPTTASQYWLLTVDLWAFTQCDTSVVVRDNWMKMETGANGDGTVLLSGGISVIGELVVAVIARSGSVTSTAAQTNNLFTGWTAGFVEQNDTLGVAYATNYPATLNTDITTDAINTDGTGSGEYQEIAFGVNPQSTIDTSIVTTAQDPAPGTLDAGTYTVVIQGRDPVGSLSTPSGSASVTVTYDQSAIAFTWTAPTSGTVSAYRLSLTAPSGTSYMVETPTNAAAYTLTTLTGAAVIASLPASGSVTPLLVRAVARTNGEAGSATSPGDAYALTTQGAWLELDLGILALTPVPRREDGTDPSWLVDIEGYNQGGPAANLDVDCLWTIPVDVPSLDFTIPGQASGVLRTWRYEQRQDGLAYSILLNGSTEAGRFRARGGLTLDPGNVNIIGCSLVIGSGVSDVVNAKATLQVWYYPVYDFEAGATV